MIDGNIKDFKGGWFYGAFGPTLNYNHDTEIGLHHYKKGFVSTPHIHKIATEINVVVHGLLIIEGIHYSDGDYWICQPMQYHEVEYLEDTSLIVVKTPSIPTDKYLL